jgi:hypothetical protein
MHFAATILLPSSAVNKPFLNDESTQRALKFPLYSRAPQGWNFRLQIHF